jgi:hypothetical protein
MLSACLGETCMLPENLHWLTKLRRTSNFCFCFPVFILVLELVYLRLVLYLLYSTPQPQVCIQELSILENLRENQKTKNKDFQNYGGLSWVCLKSVFVFFCVLEGFLGLRVLYCKSLVLTWQTKEISPIIENNFNKTTKQRLPEQCGPELSKSGSLSFWLFFIFSRVS